MKTKVQIESVFNGFASNHLILNGYAYGQEYDMVINEHTEYPLLYVIPQPYAINDRAMDYVYRVFAMDRVNDGQGATNALTIESDTDLVLKDLLGYLDEYCYRNDLELQRNFTINPVFEKTPDLLNGNWMDITIRDKYDYSSCAIPMQGEIPSDEFPYGSVIVDTVIRDKSFSFIAPLANDTASFFTSKSIRVKEVAYALQGSSPEITFNIYYASTKDSGSPTKLWTSSKVATSESGSSYTSFDNGTIPENQWVWVEIEGKSGTVDEFYTTIFFKYIL